jgi:protein associated with RNAse G/E
MTSLTVYKHDHQGALVWQYEGVLVDSGATWVCLDATFNRDDIDAGYVLFRRGDALREWFYSDRWYNIFRLQDVHDGRLKGWYCNITRPAVITAESISADDLALDVFVTPEGGVTLLDEDEFATLDLDAHDRQAALDAVEQIRQAVATRSGPFAEISA